MSRNQKKKYESPKCFDLGGKSRTVTGEDVVNSCFSGSSASGWQWCSTGTGGSDVGLCDNGNDPGFWIFEACASGTSAGVCNSGADGSADPTGCTTGLNPS